MTDDNTHNNSSDQTTPPTPLPLPPINPPSIDSLLTLMLQHQQQFQTSRSNPPKHPSNQLVLCYNTIFNQSMPHLHKTSLDKLCDLIYPAGMLTQYTYHQVLKLKTHVDVVAAPLPLPVQQQQQQPRQKSSSSVFMISSISSSSSYDHEEPIKLDRIELTVAIWESDPLLKLLYHVFWNDEMYTMDVRKVAFNHFIKIVESLYEDCYEYNAGGGRTKPSKTFTTNTTTSTNNNNNNSNKTSTNTKPEDTPTEQPSLPPLTDLFTKYPILSLLYTITTETPQHKWYHVEIIETTDAEGKQVHTEKIHDIGRVEIFDKLYGFIGRVERVEREYRRLEKVKEEKEREEREREERELENVKVGIEKEVLRRKSTAGGVFGLF
ncbi:hypothetical protein HDU76_003511 [Blyttiomyces sp. JEL0837]|nr:hypothetical protein HDU76_003511 [Blyttiomyces sp. JEL0837]